MATVEPADRLHRYQARVLAVRVAQALPRSGRTAILGCLAGTILGYVGMTDEPAVKGVLQALQAGTQDAARKKWARAHAAFKGAGVYTDSMAARLARYLGRAATADLDDRGARERRFPEVVGESVDLLVEVVGIPFQEVGARVGMCVDPILAEMWHAWPLSVGNRLRILFALAGATALKSESTQSHLDVSRQADAYRAKLLISLLRSVLPLAARRDAGLETPALRAAETSGSPDALLQTIAAQASELSAEVGGNEWRIVDVVRWQNATSYQQASCMLLQRINNDLRFGSTAGADFRSVSEGLTLAVEAEGAPSGTLWNEAAARVLEQMNATLRSWGTPSIVATLAPRGARSNPRRGRGPRPNPVNRPGRVVRLV